VDKGLGDLRRSFDRFARHRLRIGAQAANRESRPSATESTF
jgi:hypothetical protein